MPAEVTQFFTMLGNVIRIVGLISLIWGLVDLSSAKKNNEGRSQDLATYGIVFGIVLAIWGPKLMQLVVNGFNGLGG